MTRIVGAGRAEVTLTARRLGPDRENEQRVNVRRPDIGDEIAREHGDAGSEILDRGVEARSRQRGLRLVTGVLVGVDDEGIEDDGLFLDGHGLGGGGGIGGAGDGLRFGGAEGEKTGEQN